VDRTPHQRRTLINFFLKVFALHLRVPLLQFVQRFVQAIQRVGDALPRRAPSIAVSGIQEPTSKITAAKKRLMHSLRRTFSLFL
jgi:hypothetical protein